MQDSQDKDTSTDEVQSTREYKIKNTDGGEIFRTRPFRPWDPSSLLQKSSFYFLSVQHFSSKTSLWNLVSAYGAVLDKTVEGRYCTM